MTRVTRSSGSKEMSSLTERLEVVEATWKIPNFLHLISGARDDPDAELSSISRYPFFVEAPSTGSQQQTLHYELYPPVKAEAIISLRDSKLWFAISISDHSRDPTNCNLRVSVVALNVFANEYGTQVQIADFSLNKIVVVDLSCSDILAPLFPQREAENYFDVSDGSLNIYFKLQATLTAPMAATRFDGLNENSRESEALVNDFEALLKDPVNSDVEIKVCHGIKKSFRCHKVILAARSPMFRAMFESSMKETKENVVNVDDISPKTMEHFLSFMYCGRFQDNSWIQSLPELAYASDKYCVKSLQNLCDSNLIRSVNCRNALSIGKLAVRHGLRQASADIRKFIAQNAEELTLDTCACQWNLP